MKKEERIAAFAKLGERLRSDETLLRFRQPNSWFTPASVDHMLRAIANQLTQENLEKWLSAYSFPENLSPKTVAVIMAGNIPLVGFHDFMSVLLSGHRLLGKLSSDDRLLLPALAQLLTEIEPRFADRFRLTEGRLDGMDAVIATGSNNSARYFEHYFGKYPNIIRKNRHGVAVLTGNESPEQLRALADDVFRYFGLGCRNVTKIFVPRNYSFDTLYGEFFHWGEELMAHTKYMNNYEYNKAVYLLNKQALLDNNFLLLKEDIGLSSPPGVLFFERYDNLERVVERLRTDKENIQCVVAENLEGIPTVGFGQSQSPALWDYADGVDTMAFLQQL